MEQPGQPILSDNAAASLQKYQGLSYYGEVTTATSSTECKVAGLAGLGGDDVVQDFYLWVLWDAGGAGAAPQKEYVRITSYTDSDGTFIHNPLTADLAVGDKILVMNPILFEASGGGGGDGDIEIFDSFEYPSDAALQTEWLDGGYAADPTRSGTAYEGQYSMQTVVAAGGVGYLKRFLPTRNMKTFANIGIASQSSVGGDTFQFTLYDSQGNHDYWTQTCNAAPNTWTYHNINPHGTRTGGSVTPVDLADIVEIRVANLTASSTYKFDFLKFGSLVASKIGLGYDGLSDTANETSSVRGHLLLINDNMLSSSGSGTLNDANVSDTIIPSTLPTKLSMVFDISNLNIVNDDFTLEVKVGAAASERVVAYYKLTSDGADITIDTGSGTGAVVKQRRIDISGVLVYTGEQVRLNYTKTSVNDRNVAYKYICGV